MAVADKLVNLKDLKAAYDTQYNIIAAEWSSSTTYNAGDYCIYNGNLWRCKLDGISGNNYTPSSGQTWADCTAMGQVKGVRGDIAPWFSAQSTYDVGDYVMHDRTLYRCVRAITTADDWDPDDWQECSNGLAAQLSRLWHKVAPKWVSNTTYSAGNYVTYDKKFWRSKKDDNQGLPPAEGLWWHEVDISNDLAHKIDTTADDLKSALSKAYDSTATYKIGDYTMYDGELYRCRHTISTPENFFAAHWEKVELADVLQQNDELTVDTALEILKHFGSYTDESITIVNGYLYANRNNIATKIENANTCYTLIDVTPGEVYSITNREYTWLDSYLLTDDSYTIIKSAPYVVSNGAKTHEDVVIPGKATKLIVNSVPNTGIKIKKITFNDIGRYSDLHDYVENLWNRETATFGNASFTDSSKLIVSVSGINGGISLGEFITNSSKVKVNISGISTVSGTLDFFLGYYHQTSGAARYGWSKKRAGITGNSTFNISYEFDAAYLIQYENAERFNFLINTPDSSSGNIQIIDCTIEVGEGLRQSEYYDANFIDMMAKIVTAIENHEEQIESLSGSGSVQLLVNGNGRYTLGLRNNGTLVAIPNIPNKVLFMGNSLLGGMDTYGEHGGMFGMAATSPYNDYCYLVEQEILSKNSSASFTKLHDAALEQAETLSAATQWISENSEAFLSDLDLVIIQIGDNVNNETRREVFKQSFPLLCKAIRQNSDHARIIVVTGWFNAGSLTRQMAEHEGCEFISIADLNTSENQGVAGSTVTFYDGSTMTLPALYASHPGNVGFQKIAERIIEKMDM